MILICGGERKSGKRKKRIGGGSSSIPWDAVYMGREEDFYLGGAVYGEEEALSLRKNPTPDS